MNILQQYPVIIPFLSILAAESIKVTIDLMKRRSRLRFINPGGMPSGHSAFVSSLVVVTAYREGIQSTFFMIVAVVALIVMYDAVTIRYEAGKHAQSINRNHAERLEESLGHTHLEVIVGALFGAGISFFLLVM